MAVIERLGADKLGPEKSGPEKFAPPDRRAPEKRSDVEHIALLHHIGDAPLLSLWNMWARAIGNLS